MKNTYLAIDIGASSGRLMQCQRDDTDQLVLTEIHRFKNGFETKNGYDYWQIDYFIHEILRGLEKVKQAGITNCFVGIDTWGVDYCLLDKKGKRLSDPIAYRDPRTNQAVEAFAKDYSLTKLYEQTGIQIQSFNTLFQLFVEEKEKLEQADKLLLIPDYLGYVFTGNMVTEKTNASTMQLLNAGTKTWEPELLHLLGITETLFPPLVDAGTILGSLQQDHFPEYDLPEATFISVASHDTASAVLGTPAESKEWGYISSGTWSLLGVETTVANVTQDAFLANYTNEWGAHNTIRFLKNIMGMWLIQEVARMQNYHYSYAELAELASQESGFQSLIDVNDARFLNPDNMIETIQTYCRETQQKVPETPGAIARCVYDSLALCYAEELTKITRLTGGKLEKLHIVGGGSNNAFLNQLTADCGQIEVIAGPGEATAIGNIMMQMLAVGEFSSVLAARKQIKESFPCRTFFPEPLSEEKQLLIKGAKL
ncbi:rhamnulokinase [Enterococcus massiliensis]|uniref:rhamnulokinase n=1 Tax=Enterococcus massiliensis TaxID=1640685 RepID=UPI000A8FEF35|nr:rhamnulokinase [Enterococcus massiliensis]